MAEVAKDRLIDKTPTWAVVGVAAVILTISILLEKGLHHIGEWLTKKHRMTLYEVLQKIKAELMILGFISLLLIFVQYEIAGICIPINVADTMLPCPKKDASGDKTRRLLLMTLMEPGAKRRILSGSKKECDTDTVPIISVTAIKQLDAFIFFLAIIHVMSCAVIMILGRLKIRRWKDWEKETQSVDYAFINDPSRFRYADDISFVKTHSSFCNKNIILIYIKSFFNQFFLSVTKADYFTLRHGFISAHLAPGTKFNFRKYVKRTLEDDFKEVVEISATLWASVLVVLLITYNGYQNLLWASLVPPIIILIVGMKLQAIITTMAAEIQERNTVVQGIPLVQLSDHHFWFGRPKLVLSLLHLALFQNAFQITYALWILYESKYEFKDESCHTEELKYVIASISIASAGQVLCSYFTLPLYALVSQMGSHMKKTIFDEETVDALKRWRQVVKKTNRGGTQHGRSRTPSPGASARTSAAPSANASPARSMQRYAPAAHAGEPHIRASRKNFAVHINPNAERYFSEPDGDDNGEAEISMSEMGAGATARAQPVGSGDEHQGQDSYSSFSFVKLATPRVKHARS